MSQFHEKVAVSVAEGVAPSSLSRARTLPLDKNACLPTAKIGRATKIRQVFTTGSGPSGGIWRGCVFKLAKPRSLGIASPAANNESAGGGKVRFASSA